MAKQDYYETLGVRRDADADTLKKAFRSLAMKCHPDRNPDDNGAEQRFKEINEAYDVLKDEQKRAAYDRFGHAAFENGAGTRGGGGFEFHAGGFADIFDEMFGEFMGGRRGRQSRRRGAPRRPLHLPLLASPRLFQRDGANPHCRVPIPMTTAALGGSIEVPAVDGSRARIAIPPGAQHGQQFRLRGKGMSVLRSPARGDMLVEIAVETPVNLTKRQQELLQEFDKAAGKHKNNSPQSEGFFAKFKEFWEDLKE